VGGRAMRGFAWAGVISCCFLGFWTAHAGLAWVPFALVGGLCGVCQPVLTDAHAVRAAIEATYDGPPAGSPQAKALLRSRPFSTESVTTNEIAGAVTDLIFSAASVFAAARPSDGWEEVR
jgi:hypothetical protein